MSLTGRKVLLLFCLASGLHVLWEDLRSLPEFGSRGKFVRALHQNSEDENVVLCEERSLRPLTHNPPCCPCVLGMFALVVLGLGEDWFLWGLNRVLDATWDSSFQQAVVLNCVLSPSRCWPHVLPELCVPALWGLALLVGSTLPCSNGAER